MIKYLIEVRDEGTPGITVKAKVLSHIDLTAYEHNLIKNIKKEIEKIVKSSAKMLLQVDNGNDELFETLKKELYLRK